jgi:transcriptional regulator with XRE-family HTH domain
MIDFYNGELLKVRRKARKWTQADVCLKTGLSKNQVIAMEKGRFEGGVKYLLKYLDLVGLQITLEQKRYEFPQLEDLPEIFKEEN